MTPKPETTPEPEVEPTPEPELLTTQQTFGLYAGFIALLFILCVILLVLYLKQRKRLNKLAEKVGNNKEMYKEKPGLA